MGKQSSSSTVALNANATAETSKNALRTASERLGVATWSSCTHEDASVMLLARRRSQSSTVIRASSDATCASDDISCSHGTAINGRSASRAQQSRPRPQN